MSGQHVRHARTSWEYGTPGRRGDELAAVVTDQLADPAPAKAPPRSKDTRRNCGGHRGREHQPVIIEDLTDTRDCKWEPGWNRTRRRWAGTAWHCRHQEACSACGKILRTGLQLDPPECDAYPGDPAQHGAALAETERLDNRPLSAWRLRKVPDGPQGYRRPRPGN